MVGGRPFFPDILLNLVILDQGDEAAAYDQPDGQGRKSRQDAPEGQVFEDVEEADFLGQYAEQMVNHPKPRR
jgi:hypothetical protein